MQFWFNDGEHPAIPEEGSRVFSLGTRSVVRSGGQFSG